jgi:sec-independent protein translocase protein TatA
MHIHAILLFLGELGGGEIMVIMLAVLLLFGANKIPGIARSLGSGIREFKDATNNIRQELERSVQVEAPPVRPQPPAKPAKKQPPPTSPQTAGPDTKKAGEDEDPFEPGNID